MLSYNKDEFCCTGFSSKAAIFINVKAASWFNLGFGYSLTRGRFECEIKVKYYVERNNSHPFQFATSWASATWIIHICMIILLLRVYGKEQREE